MDLALAELRSFNRFYTRFSGALNASFLGSELALAAVRLLYEIADRDEALATELQADLGMDPGYISRILRDFQRRGWIVRGRGDDARRRPISLTNEGRAAFQALDDRQRDVTAEQIAPLGESDRHMLVASLGIVRTLLERKADAGVTLREFRTGDMGMITARQSVLYAETQEWGRPVEILIGKITFCFLRDFKSGREQCWIAEAGGRMLGSVFLVDDGEGYARLRLLYVEPDAQGRGIGTMLIQECLNFARAAGYRGIWLWTHGVLHSARRLYKAAGFEIVARESHDAFDAPVESETWKLSFELPAIAPPTSGEDIAAVARLFEAYAHSLDVDLAYQDFANELAGLPGAYVPPHGALLLARNADGVPIGCVALRPMARVGTCEMKRLYVAPDARGSGLGRRLVEAAINQARAIGYQEIFLDTLPSMTAAQGLYQALGFVAIDPYYDTPITGSVFLRRQLD